MTAQSCACGCGQPATVGFWSTEACVRAFMQKINEAVPLPDIGEPKLRPVGVVRAYCGTTYTERVEAGAGVAHTAIDMSQEPVELDVDRLDAPPLATGGLVTAGQIAVIGDGPAPLVLPPYGYDEGIDVHHVEMEDITAIRSERGWLGRALNRMFGRGRE